jgi:glycosyltransferase involved in cell wall biosynthesis
MRFRTNLYARDCGFATGPRSSGNLRRRSGIEPQRVCLEVDPLPANARRAMSRTLFFLPELVAGDAAPLSAKESALSMARRPVIFDMSHLIARLRARTGTGIDRIDLAFALHFFAEGGASEAVRYGSGPPRLMSAKWALRFTRAARGFWTDDASARAEALWDWLESSPSSAAKPKFAAPSRNSGSAWGRRLLSWTGYLVGSALLAVPARAIYLNIGYHRFEQPRFFAWLAKRPDVDGVFMIHDLLPLDYPEFFEDGETEKFRARIDTALRYGRAFLVSTEVVRRRLQQEMAARGFEERPIWAQPFPSPLAAFTPSLSALRRPKHPYFVVIGTIEPRKNHLLLLNVWRALVRYSPNPPRLVIVGERGWENEQVIDILDRCETLAPHIAEVSGLGSRDLADLIAGARAVLAPSFDEGYGLPIVEALSLGAPVVASDSPAAREVSQGRARLLSPVDGERWRVEIERLATDDHYYAEQQARSAGFRAPNWRDYFASLDQFLAGLRPLGRS